MKHSMAWTCTIYIDNCTACIDNIHRQSYIDSHIQSTLHILPHTPHLHTTHHTIQSTLLCMQAHHHIMCASTSMLYSCMLLKHLFAPFVDHFVDHSASVLIPLQVYSNMFMHCNPLLCCSPFVLMHCKMLLCIRCQALDPSSRTCV